MYAYHQSSGKFYHDEQLIGIGYSGQPPHKNQGSAQNIPEYGPIPQGAQYYSDAVSGGNSQTIASSSFAAVICASISSSFSA